MLRCGVLDLLMSFSQNRDAPFIKELRRDASVAKYLRRET
jgi:hypothetical protein